MTTQILNIKYINIIILYQKNKPTLLNTLSIMIQQFVCKPFPQSAILAYGVCVCVCVCVYIYIYTHTHSGFDLNGRMITPSD